MSTNLHTLLLTSVLIAVNAACVKMPRRTAVALDGATRTAGPSQNIPPVSINRATREELERLPGIGPSLAARIVEQRERHGPFRRVEHLLIVRGISERRFREIRTLINAE